jgi:hypothetical protein
MLFLDAALTEVAPQVLERMRNQANARVRVMTLVEGAADTTPHVVAMGYKPTAMRAAVEFGHEEASLAGLIKIAESTLSQISQIADAQSSCALAGREYVFCPGDQPYTLRVFMGGSLEKTYEDFHSHWLNSHGWIVKPRVDARKAPIANSMLIRKQVSLLLARSASADMNLRAAPRAFNLMSRPMFAQ